MYHDRKIPAPMREVGLVLKREGNDVFTNVPHYVSYHSPDGFEWGYGGSGPADLALNCVEHILRLSGFKGPSQGEVFRASLIIYQTFKTKFIMPCPKEGGQVSWDVLEDFVREQIELRQRALREMGVKDVERKIGVFAESEEVVL